MAPGKRGLASESSWVCSRGAEHPPLELNLVIFTELVPSAFSLRFSWKISLFASCRSCWACGWQAGPVTSGKKTLSFPMSGFLCGLPVTPFIEVKCSSFDWSWWDFCLDFTCSEVYLGEEQSGELWGRGSVEAALSKVAELQPGCIGALLALPREFAEQLHPGAVCKGSSNPPQFGG